MPTVNVPVFRGQKSDLETDWRDDLPVNLIYVPKQVLGSPGYLRSEYGLALFTTASGIDRGGVYNANQLAHYRVSGTEAVIIDTAGNVTELGTVPGGSQVTMLNTFTNQVFTASGSVFLHNDTDGFRPITDPNVGNPFDSVYINRVLVHTDGEFLIPSDVADDEAYTFSKRGVAESLPDGILGVGSLYNKLIAFGRYSIEYYFFSGAATGFPFDRIDAQYIAAGIVGTHAKTYWPDNDGAQTYAFIGGTFREPVGVRLLGSGTAPKISTREIDQILLTYTEDELSTAVLERRKLENNDFLICHLPRHVLVYDRSASAQAGGPIWTIRTSDTEGVEPARWINGVYDPRTSEWYYGDKIDGRVGRLEKTLCTQYDTVTTEMFATPLIPLPRKSVHEIQMEHLPGRCDVADTPTLFMATTENGLQYSQERLMQRGTRADYNRKLIRRRIGYFDDTVGFRFRKTDRTPMAVTNLTVTVG